MAETNIKVLKLEVDTGTGAIKVNGITKSIEQAEKATKEFVSSSQQLGKALDQNRDKTGLAGAAVVEIGRTISDANYGFTAMANNISQLGTLMSTLVATSGGLKNGLRELGKAFAGPLGIIVVFQIAVTIFEKFAKNAKKTENSLEGISKAAGAAGTKLTVLKNVIKDNNISLEEKQRAVKAANEEYDGLNLRLDENGQLTDESTEAIDRKIDALKRLAKANAFVKELEKLYGELALSATKTDSEFVTTINNISKGLGTLGQGAGLIDVLIGTEEENRQRITEQINALVKLMEEGELIDEMLGSDNGGKLKPKTKEKIKKIASEIIGTTIEQARKLADEGDSIIDKLLGAEPSDWAKDALGKNATEALKGLYKQYIEPEEEDFFSQWVDRKLDQIDELTFGLESLATGLDAAAIITDAAYQKELDIEQNKTTAINNELKKRLANEELSANERKGIQGQIAANDEALRIKQEAIEKKRFKTEKAFRISLTLIDTASSAMRAYASQLIPADPSSLIRAKIAAATTTAFGLAQVASIAMQQFVSSQSSLGAGAAATSGSTGANVQAPDFNIVGQSNVNQLAEVVSSQLDKPIKTYVVTKDVSTAQSMERNIVNGSSIG